MRLLPFSARGGGGERNEGKSQRDPPSKPCKYQKKEEATVLFCIFGEICYLQRKGKLCVRLEKKKIEKFYSAYTTQVLRRGEKGKKKRKVKGSQKSKKGKGEKGNKGWVYWKGRRAPFFFRGGEKKKKGKKKSLLTKKGDALPQKRGEEEGEISLCLRKRKSSSNAEKKRGEGYECPVR